MATTPVRRLAADEILLPDGATPTGTSGRILEAALGLFAQWGFHGTSIRAIGAEVGINSASLYAHYDSKEEILRDLIMIGISELDRQVRSAVAVADGPVDQLRAAVHEHVLAHASFPLLAVVTNSEQHALSPELAEPAVRIRAELQKLLTTILESGVREGVFDTPDPVLAGRAIAGMGQHVAHWFRSQHPDEREDVANRYVDFALRTAGAA
jgi:AcrR family transcriptional regulator